MPLVAQGPSKTPSQSTDVYDATPRVPFSSTRAGKALNEQMEMLGDPMAPITPLAKRAYSNFNRSALPSAVAPALPPLAITAPGPAHPAQNPSRYVVSPMYGPPPPPPPPSDVSSSDKTWSSLRPSMSGSNLGSSSFGPATMHGKEEIAQLAADSGIALGPTDNRWNDELFGVFRMVLGWIKENCDMRSGVTMSQMASQSPKLWDYMCSVTYPRHRVYAQNHAIYMLNTPQYRLFFLTRLLIQYIVQQMWDIKLWEGLDESLTHTVVSIKRRLERVHGYGMSFSFNLPLRRRPWLTCSSQTPS